MEKVIPTQIFRIYASMLVLDFLSEKYSRLNRTKVSSNPNVFPIIHGPRDPAKKDPK